MSSSTVYTLTIQPCFSDFEEPISRYIKRTNYGSSMTVYTIDNKISALLTKKRLENEGYIVHIEDPDGSSQSSNAKKIVAGNNIS